MFHRLSDSAKPLESVARRFWLRNIATLNLPASMVGEVDWRTRDSYAKAFDIPVLEQLLIEEELRQVDLDDLRRAQLRIV